ncbi:MAG: hypothetical protein D6769_02055 [Methanobacteriota archaeon]|nr:MAG: hypothetical protein D6769_02055 [Euryarchaeota archaeon]
MATKYRRVPQDILKKGMKKALADVMRTANSRTSLGAIAMDNEVIPAMKRVGMQLSKVCEEAPTKEEFVQVIKSISIRLLESIFNMEKVYKAMLDAFNRSKGDGKKEKTIRNAEPLVERDMEPFPLDMAEKEEIGTGWYAIAGDAEKLSKKVEEAMREEPHKAVRKLSIVIGKMVDNDHDSTEAIKILRKAVFAASGSIMQNLMYMLSQDKTAKLIGEHIASGVELMRLQRKIEMKGGDGDGIVALVHSTMELKEKMLELMKSNSVYNKEDLGFAFSTLCEAILTSKDYFNYYVVRDLRNKGKQLFIRKGVEKRRPYYFYHRLLLEYVLFIATKHKGNEEMLYSIEGTLKRVREMYDKEGLLAIYEKGLNIIRKGLEKKGYKRWADSLIKI